MAKKPRKAATPVPRRKYPPVSRFKFLAGPYRAPKIKGVMHDEMLGDVPVVGMTKAPIPWPATEYRGESLPILAGDLVRAVCEEEERAVAHYWGVSKYIVGRWRAAIARATDKNLVHTILALKRQDPIFRKTHGYGLPGC